MLWNEQREEWVGNKPRQQSQGSRESVISGSTTYEDLLGTSRPFPQPVHLPEMVEFLVDVWEQEGLYEIRWLRFSHQFFVVGSWFVFMFLGGSQTAHWK
jgi:hypothetical protein